MSHKKVSALRGSSGVDTGFQELGNKTRNESTRIKTSQQQVEGEHRAVSNPAATCLFTEQSKSENYLQVSVQGFTAGKRHPP